MIEGRARVVGEDVDDVCNGIARRLLDPARDGVVLVRAVATGQLGIGAVTHEYVREPELGLACKRRARHEITKCRRAEVLEHVPHLLDRTASHRGERTHPEGDAHHRRVAEHTALRGGQDVQACGDQRLSIRER